MQTLSQASAGSRLPGTAGARPGEALSGQFCGLAWLFSAALRGHTWLAEFCTTSGAQRGAQPDVALGVRRVLTELVSKMRDMHMDKTELGCLRAIVLFNPGTAGLPLHALPQPL